MSNSTIAAIATPPGRGGVGIVRISGPLAYSIGLALTKLSSLSPRSFAYTSFYDHFGEVIDQGLLLYFKAPHSFTGEDVVECQLHGSPLILDALLVEAIHFGAVLAKPGEFSERAFLNNKLDLLEVEAIADIIAANSKAALKMAQKTLQGVFSDKINQLNENIIHLRLYVEAAIDFPEEEIDFLTEGPVNRLLQEIIDTLDDIKKEASLGAMIREGVAIVIVGKPNVGKSTLLNFMAKKEVAIVTDIPGTTRDVMKEAVLLEDLPVHFIDTAGIRNSNDPIEQEGIKRAWQHIREADCVLHVLDYTQPKSADKTALEQEILSTLPEGTPIIRVVNKCDVLEATDGEITEDIMYISAKTGEGMATLTAAIKKAVGFQPTEGQFLARRRHLQALNEASQYLLTGQLQLKQHRAGELLADDLRKAHHVLGEITGEFTSDDLLGKIFSSFCIGK